MQLTLTNLGLFETDKEQRKEFVNQVIEGLNEGSVDPLKVHLQVKCMEDIIKQLTSSKEYKEICLTEAVKFGRNFEHHNAKFEIKEMGVKYDYSNCNDPILKHHELELSIAEEAVKARQAILKALPSEGMEILIEDELVRIYPPSKTSTTTVTVNLK
jgi:hypothetical protein